MSLLFKQSIIIISYLLLYAGYNILFGENSNTIVLTILKALLLAIFFIVSYRYPANYSLLSYRNVLLALFFFILLQVIILDNFKAIKILGINLIAFILFVKWSSKKLIEIWLWSIKITAVLASISAAYLAYKLGEFIYLRDEVFVDKSYITAFYCISFISIVTDLSFNRNRFYNSIIFIIVFIVDLLIVQSKISLFILGVSFIFCQYLRRRFQFRHIIESFFLIIISFIIINSILPEDSVVLDPIKQGINQLCGTDFLETKRTNMKTDTYDIRDELWRYCFDNILPEHPLLGIGLGNFRDYAKKGPAIISFLEETESSLLSVITEGGIIYLFLMILFFIKPIRSSYKYIKTNMNSENVFFFLFFVGYAIMCIGNDFLDSLFWIQSGLMVGVLYNNETLDNDIYI